MEDVRLKFKQQWKANDSNLTTTEYVQTTFKTQERQQGDIGQRRSAFKRHWKVKNDNKEFIVIIFCLKKEFFFFLNKLENNWDDEIQPLLEWINWF